MRRRFFPFAAASSALVAVLIFPPGASPSGAAQECIQKTRGGLYSQTTNDRYKCEFDGKKLVMEDFGRRIPAPEGTYRIGTKVSAPKESPADIEDGRICYVGKGGYLLYCSR